MRSPLRATAKSKHSTSEENIKSNVLILRAHTAHTHIRVWVLPPWLSPSPLPFPIYLFEHFESYTNALCRGSSSRTINHSHPTKYSARQQFYTKWIVDTVVPYVYFSHSLLQRPFLQLLTMLPSWYVCIVIRQFAQKEKKDVVEWLEYTYIRTHIEGIAYDHE